MKGSTVVGQLGGWMREPAGRSSAESSTIEFSNLLIARIEARWDCSCN